MRKSRPRRSSLAALVQAALVQAALAIVLARGGEAMAQPSPEGLSPEHHRDATPPTAAAPDGPGLVAGRSACPEPGAVWSELGTLVPREHVDARLRALAAAGTPVELVDLGGSYRVIAAGRLREYRDDGRDCAHRARIAALFVALAVDPAWILSEPAPPPPPPPVAAPAVRAAAPEPVGIARTPVARVSLAATAEAGLGSQANVAQAGGWLRVAVGGGRLAPAAGVGLLAPVSTTVGGVAVDAWRVPADVGVRFALGGGRVERAAELGVSAALAWARGTDLASPRTDATLEVGVHGALGVTFRTAGRVAPFAAVRAEVVPHPATLFALPQGELGTFPVFRIGLAAGAELEFF